MKFGGVNVFIFIFYREMECYYVIKVYLGLLDLSSFRGS